MANVDPRVMAQIMQQQQARQQMAQQMMQQDQALQQQNQALQRQSMQPQNWAPQRRVMRPQADSAAPNASGPSSPTYSGVPTQAQPQTGKGSSLNIGSPMTPMGGGQSMGSMAYAPLRQVLSGKGSTPSGNAS